MIIDQLPLLSGDAQTTDEFPIERGTTTYKVTLDRLLAALPKDAIPTSGSTNVVESGGVYDALETKQNALTFDSAPTQGSSNPVTSGGVYDALENAGGGSALYFTNIACAAATGDFATISDAKITEDSVVSECVFANPSAVTSDVTWTTSSGSLVLNGTCSTATTVNLVLVKTN